MATTGSAERGGKQGARCAQHRKVLDARASITQKVKARSTHRCSVQDWRVAVEFYQASRTTSSGTASLVQARILLYACSGYAL